MWGDISSWDRRDVLKLAGISATGTVVLSQPGVGAEKEPDVSVTFENQESDGASVVIGSLYTEVDAEVIIFHSEGDRRRYKVLNVEGGTEFSDRTVELDEPIPDTQLISISVQPPGGGYSYGGARATVAVDEPVGESDSGGSESGIELVEADPDAGFQWPYLLYTPRTAGSNEREDTASGGTETRPLVVGNSPRRGLPSDTDGRLESGRAHIEHGRLRAIADELNSPALVALIPGRTDDGVGRNIRLSESNFERLDLQVLAMVDDARDRLADQPYEVPEKLHVDGFSSNGRFFDKFTALHPERINAVSAGGNGVVVLPLEELTADIPTAGDPSTATPPWPVGVATLQELTGNEFDREAWFDTTQFWYIGAEDQDPGNPGEYIHKLYRGSGEGDALIADIFGSLQVDDRFKTSQAIFEQIGAPAVFTAYEGAGHEVTREMGTDILAFHRRQKHEEFGPQFDRTIEWPNGPVTVGETLSILISYENLGATEAVATPALLVDGETVESTDVELMSGNVEEVQFEHSFTSPGEYTVSVDAVESKTFEVTAEATESGADADNADDTGQTPAQEDSTAEEQPGFGLIQAIGALGGGGYLLKRRMFEGEP